MGLVKNRRKDSVNESMFQLLAGYPVDMITCYNAKAFAAHKEVTEALNTAVYFAHL